MCESQCRPHFSSVPSLYIPYASNPTPALGPDRLQLKGINNEHEKQTIPPEVSCILGDSDTFFHRGSGR